MTDQLTIPTGENGPDSDKLPTALQWLFPEGVTPDNHLFSNSLYRSLHTVRNVTFGGDEVPMLMAGLEWKRSVVDNDLMLEFVAAFKALVAEHAAKFSVPPILVFSFPEINMGNIFATNLLNQLQRLPDLAGFREYLKANKIPVMLVGEAAAAQLVIRWLSYKMIPCKAPEDADKALQTHLREVAIENRTPTRPDILNRKQGS
jgi:hypothetical protein